MVGDDDPSQVASWCRLWCRWCYGSRHDGGSRMRSRQRGQIEALPSGALRVKVFAGRDPVSKRRLYLSETIPPGPRQARLAEQARTIPWLPAIIETGHPDALLIAPTWCQRFDSCKRAGGLTDPGLRMRGRHGGVSSDHGRPTSHARPPSRLPIGCRAQAGQAGNRDNARRSCSPDEGSGTATPSR